MTMNILVLEHPRLPSKPHFNDIANTPLWSCIMAGYVFSALEGAGFKPHILNANEQGLDFKQTVTEICAYQPDLLTVNTVYFWEHTGLFFKMIRDLRHYGFTGHINLFGFFPTLHYRRLLQERGVDSIAVGECEQTLVELAQSLPNCYPVKGLATKEFPFVPRKQVENLDTLAFPFRTKAQLKHSVSILASRGCYNHCSFCPIPSFYNDGPLWRGRSVADIIEEITELMEQGADSFYFVDPNFIGPGRAGRGRTVDLLNQLRPLSLRFGMETRATDLDDGLMEHLVQAGLTTLLLGVESGSNTGLQDFGKNETVDESARGIALCRRAGIEPEIGFLMFTPNSTPLSLRENMKFLEQNDLLDRLDRTANLLCHQQIIMAGTTGFKQYDKRGILKTNGPFDFIGKVEFQSAKVKRAAEAVTSLCHFILRETGRKDSPIYFQTAGSYSKFSELNELLVAEIKHHFEQPESADMQCSLQKLQDHIKIYTK